MFTPLIPIAAFPAGAALWFNFVTPTEGTWAAAHGWDGDGPGTIALAQDVAIPAGTASLLFDYRAGWDLVTFCVTPPCQDRTFTVEIEPAGGGVALQSTVVLTTNATINPDTGPLLGSVSVAAFAGQTVRISFEWFVPQDFTGPAEFQLDNVRLQ